MWRCRWPAARCCARRRRRRRTSPGSWKSRCPESPRWPALRRRRAAGRPAASRTSAGSCPVRRTGRGWLRGGPARRSTRGQGRAAGGFRGRRGRGGSTSRAGTESPGAAPLARLPTGSSAAWSRRSGRLPADDLRRPAGVRGPAARALGGPAPALSQVRQRLRRRPGPGRILLHDRSSESPATVRYEGSLIIRPPS
jgi:hypothetical protein